MKKKRLLSSRSRRCLASGLDGRRRHGAARQDAKAGAKKVDMCIGCHDIPGYQASFPEIYKVPKIAGQNAKYIVAALDRVPEGRPQAPDACARIADVAVRPGHGRRRRLLRAARQGRAGTGHGAPAPPAAVAKLLAQANCVSCHGANFSKPIDPSYPKLAGQYADYLYAALKAYQTEGNPHIGRNNAIMMGMARPFTHAEIKAIAGYLSSLPGEIKTVQLPEFR